MSEKQLVQFNCPKELLKEFDDTWNGKFGDRTAALHAAMRLFNEKYKEAPK